MENSDNLRGHGNGNRPQSTGKSGENDVPRQVMENDNQEQRVENNVENCGIENADNRQEARSNQDGAQPVNAGEGGRRITVLSVMRTHVMDVFKFISVAPPYIDLSSEFVNWEGIKTAYRAYKRLDEQQGATATDQEILTAANALLRLFNPILQRIETCVEAAYPL